MTPKISLPGMRVPLILAGWKKNDVKQTKGTKDRYLNVWRVR